MHPASKSFQSHKVSTLLTVIFAIHLILIIWEIFKLQIIGLLFDFLRYWKALQNLLKSLINSIEAIASLLLLLFLILGIFALLGAQLFGGKFKEVQEEFGLQKPRHHFDSFFQSLFTVFQVLYPPHIFYKSILIERWRALMIHWHK